MFDGVKIEVHLSNPAARESWRHGSVIAPVVDGTITGLRAEGYRLAVEAAEAKPTRRTGRSSDAPGPARHRIPARAPARGSRGDRRACSSPSSPTSGTSPASPDRPRCWHRQSGSTLFVTDGRYTEQSKEQLAAAGVDDEVRIEIGLTAAAQGVALAKMVDPGTRLGLEDHSVTWADQRGFVTTFEGVELVPAGTLVEDLRRVKDPGEGRLRRSGVRRSPTMPSSRCFPARGRRHRAAVRSRARVPDAREARCKRQQLRPDHRGRPQRGQAARPSVGSDDRPQRARRVRLRLHRRRLLLRHDAHGLRG